MVCPPPGRNHYRTQNSRNTQKHTRDACMCLRDDSFFVNRFIQIAQKARIMDSRVASGTNRIENWKLKIASGRSHFIRTRKAQKARNFLKIYRLEFSGKSQNTYIAALVWPPERFFLMVNWWNWWHCFCESLCSHCLRAVTFYSHAEGAVNAALQRWIATRSLVNRRFATG